MDTSKRRIRDLLRRRGPQVLPSSRAMVREALCLLAPWNVGIPLVRLGGAGDGGYLVPDDFDGIEALLSPGVAETWDFERYVGEHLGLPAYMIDGAVDAPEGLTHLQHFERLWLGSESGEGRIALADWVGAISSEHSGDLMLQMDIEGAEYQVLASAPLSTLRRFRTVIVEFHGLDWMLFAPVLRLRILPALRKMAIDFEVAHVHANNCCGSFTAYGIQIPRVLEVTYLRRDRSLETSVRAELPHPLDRECVPSAPPVLLPPTWPKVGGSEYRSASR